MKLEVAGQSEPGSGDISFNRMSTAFERAWTIHPGRRWQSFCTFAGRAARLRVVGHGLSQHIAGAFRHLLVKNSSPKMDLEIDLWDQAETSVPWPVEPEPVEPRLLKSTSYVEFGLI